jgi:hypothetical protein
MCKPSMTGSPRGQWPSRLLAVGEHNDTAVRLCETSKIISSTLHYTTLSHCWGDFVPIRLLTTNISEFLRGIPLDSIPRTFRDAVETTRSLGLSYLWIDSICILQDSAQDWAVESNRMYEIYRNSYLNLAAVASTNATGGLVHSSSLLSRIPCNVMVGRGKYQERALTSYVSGTHRNAKDLPLLSRAWVFQEILLPSRMLLFTRDEVCWECNGMSRTETYPEGEPTHQEGEVKPVDGRVIPFREAWQEISEESSSSRFDLWNRMVSHYSQKKMSKPADKLVAVAGLAHDLGQIWPEAEYLAGIWSFDLVHGLLWHCFGRTRLRFYNAPSWSWASVDGEVDVHSHHDSRFCDKLVEVIEARTFHSSPTMAYGAVTDGYLRLKGPLFQAQIVMEYGNSNTYTIRFLDDSHKGALGSFRVKIDIRVSWDDYGFYEIYHIARPFLMPFEISLKDDATVLIMQGIILSPVRSQKGQYQRIGWFEIEDRPSRPDDYDSESPGGVSSEEDATEMSIAVQADANGLSEKPQLKITDGLDSNASNDGSSPSPLLGNDEEAWRDHCFTVFDLQQLFEEADNEKETLPKFSDLRPLSWMPDEADQSPHEDHLDEHDKFSNGLIDWTLLRRYEDQMDEEDYPNINSFLAFTLIYYEGVILEKKECDWQYEESHGDGIFTIRVV